MSVNQYKQTIVQLDKFVLSPPSFVRVATSTTSYRWLMRDMHQDQVMILTKNVTQKLKIIDAKQTAMRTRTANRRPLRPSIFKQLARVSLVPSIICCSVPYLHTYSTLRSLAIKFLFSLKCL